MRRARPYMALSNILRFCMLRILYFVHIQIEILGPTSICYGKHTFTMKNMLYLNAYSKYSSTQVCAMLLFKLWKLILLLNCYRQVMYSIIVKCSEVSLL